MTTLCAERSENAAISRGHTVTVAFEDNDFTVTDSVDGALWTRISASSVSVEAGGAVSFSALGVAASP